jgi:hypothetical protein
MAIIKAPNWRGSTSSPSVASLEKTNQGYRDRLSAVGFDPTPPKPRRSFLQWAGDVASRGDYAGANWSQHMLDNAKGIFAPGRTLGQRLTSVGKTLFDPTLYGEVWQGLTGKKRGDFKTVAANAGFSTQAFKDRGGLVGNTIGKIPLLKNWSPAGTAGLGASIANPFDPLNYVGLGKADDAAKAAAKAAGKNAGEWGLKLGGKVIAEMPRTRKGLLAAGKFLAEDAPGISKVIQAVGPHLSRNFKPAGISPEVFSAFRGMADAYDSALPYVKSKAIDTTIDRLKAKSTPKQIRDQIGELLELPEFYDNPNHPLVQQVLGEARHWDDMVKAANAAGIPVAERYLYRPRLTKTNALKEVVQRFTGRKTSPLRANLGAANKRTFFPDLPFREANAKVGYEAINPDYLLSAAAREVDHAGAMETNRFLDDVLKRFGIKLDGNTPLPQGMVEFTARQYGQSVPYALPKAIGDQLNQYVKYASGDDPFKVLDPLTSWWKSRATGSLGFNVRNKVGNMFRRWQTDTLNPAADVAAIQARLGSKRVLKTAAGDIPLDQVLEMARKSGAIEKMGGTAFTEGTDGLAKAIAERLGEGGVKGYRKLGSLNPLSADFVLPKNMRRLGDTVENTDRLAVFIEGLKKGLTPEDAAKLANKTLYDYTNLTPFLRNVRRFVPFMSWSANNIPAQVRLLLENPAKITRPLKVMKAARQEFGQNDTNVPDYMKRLEAFPTGEKDANGNPLYANPNIPLQDLNKTNPLEFIMQGMHPAAKEAIERYTGQSLYFNRPVERYPGAKTSLFGAPVRERDFNTVRNFDPLTGSFAKLFQQYMARKKKQTGLDNVDLQNLSLWGGIKLMPYNAKQEQLNKAYTEQDRLRNIIRLLQDSGQLPKAGAKTASSAFRMTPEMRKMMARWGR